MINCLILLHLHLGPVSALRHNYGIMKSSLEFDLKATYPFLTTVRKSATELLETATKLQACCLLLQEVLMCSYLSGGCYVQRAIKYSNVGEACVLARSAEECARGIESQLMTEEKTEGVTFTQVCFSLCLAFLIII